MGHIWGINWQSHHKDQYDFPHVERMGYKLVLLYNWMWDNDGFCNDLLAAAPQDCIFIIRDQPLSEQKQDMYADPAGTGRRHAREWAEKLQQGRIKLPLDRCWFQGINEPDSNHAQQAIDTYTLELTLGLAAVGARTSGWVFGTGHPSTVNLDPKGAIDWHWYAASAQALAEHDGLADFHAYGSWNNMLLDNHLCRMETCPYALPAVFTETGIDEGAVSQATAGQGYKAHLSPDQYIAWLDAMQVRVRQRLANSKLDLKALGIFTYDFGEAEDSQSWEPYDVRACRDQLVATRWTTPPYTKPQEQVYIPVIAQPGPTPPTAEPVEPQPPAPQYPAGIIDPRALAAILQVESGGAGFVDKRLKIRFEAHVFRSELHDDTRWGEHYRVGSPQWTGQQWRMGPGDMWRMLHAGPQDDEWAAFRMALAIDTEAACRSISMGAPQIMGFNHLRIGYPTAQAMFEAFQESEATQLFGLINFVLSDPALADALRRRDWRTTAALYNGTGAVNSYSALLEAAYQAAA